MDHSQLTQKTIDSLLPFFLSEKNTDALSAVLTAADAPAPQLWKLLEPIIIEEFSDGGQLSGDVADPKVLGYILKKKLKKDAALHAGVLAILQKQKDTAPGKNQVDQSQIEAGGHVQIGDQGETVPMPAGQKNSVSGSVIKAGGNVQVGDRNQNNTEHQIAKQEIHNHYGQQKAPTSLPIDFKAELSALEGSVASEVASQAKRLVAGAQLKKSIGLLMEFSQKHQIKALELELAGLAMRLEEHAQKYRKGLLSTDEGTREKNQVTDAVLQLLQQFPD